MKKRIAFILAVLMLLSAVSFSFASCSNGDGVEEDTKAETDAPVNGNSGEEYYLSNITVCETEDFTVNAAMMAYFYAVQLSNYSSYLSMLGIDIESSLKTQECPLLKEGTGSWFTYFVELTKGHVTEVLALCQTAHDNGITLDSTDRYNIDSYVSAIASMAASMGYTTDEYISSVVKNPATADDLRACLELEILAEKFMNVYLDNLTYTEEEIEEYYLGDKMSYSLVDVYAFTVTAEEGTEDDIRVGMQTIAKATTPEEYKAFVKAFVTTLGMVENDEAADELVAGCLYERVDKNGFYYAAEWALNADLWETYVEEVDGVFTVFMIARDAYKDESLTRNVRHVLLSNETYSDSTAADAMYEDWGDAGYTEDAIAALAMQYSSDSVSSVDGGLMENVGRGTTVTSFDNWLFAEDRAPGDHGIIESEYGWHIMYYVGEGEPVWRYKVVSAMKDETYTALVRQYIASIEYNEDSINEIDG